MSTCLHVCMSACYMSPACLPCDTCLLVTCHLPAYLAIPVCSLHVTCLLTLRYCLFIICYPACLPCDTCLRVMRYLHAYLAIPAFLCVTCLLILRHLPVYYVLPVYLPRDTCLLVMCHLPAYLTILPVNCMLPTCLSCVTCLIIMCYLPAYLAILGLRTCLPQSENRTLNRERTTDEALRRQSWESISKCNPRLELTTTSVSVLVRSR